MQNKNDLTDKQIELLQRGEGWVAWDGSLKSSAIAPVNINQYGFVMLRNGTISELHLAANWENSVTGLGHLDIVAYRLAQVLNAENAKDTTVSEQCEDLIENDSPDEIEWKKGKLPPIGIDCEVYTSGVWKAGFTAGKNKEGNIVVQVGENYIAKGSANSFRSLQTEREKVIEKALAMAIDNPTNIDGLLNMYYDAGMLKLPEGE